MKTRAFTIVEVMVVLAIGAVFLGIGIPAFRALMGYKERAPLEQAISDVEDICRKARIEAILGKQVMEVYLNDVEDVVALSTAPRAVMGMDLDTGVETRQAQPGEEKRRLELTADMEIIAPRDDEFDGELRLRFYPNGTAEAAEVRISEATGAYRLAIDPVTGQTMVENEEDL
jgi:prepilin-type N-terminal cleavage/methylation domain-containing protein